jgi:hypothetical protein
MGSYDDLLRCSIGDASFQLEDYSVEDAPVLEEIASGPGAGTGATSYGRRYRLSCRGFLVGDDAADYAAKLQAFTRAVRRRSQNFIIYGLAGEVEFELLAAQCVQGGPYVTVKRSEQSQGSPLRRDLSFTVEGQTIETDDGGGGGSTPQTDTYRTTTEKRPDALLSIRRAGELKGVNLTAYFDDTTYAQFRAAYPLPNWVVEFRKEEDAAGSTLKYELTAIELIEPLPVHAGTEAVDGTYSHKQEDDASTWRVTETYAWDLLIVGSAEAMEARIRPVGANVVIARSSVEITGLRERRLRATYTTIRSSHGSGFLLEWQNDLDFARESTFPTVAKEYDGGANPLIHYGPTPVYRTSQRGRAVGLMKIPPPAPRVRDVTELANPDRITVRRLNALEWETSWAYEFITTSPTPPELARLEPPASMAPYTGGN